MKVTAPAQISKVSTLSDGSIKIEVVTQELPSNEMATLFDLRKDIGWFLFASNALQESDIPEQVAESEAKTPSQRLRGVVFLLWKQQGSRGNFDTYYRSAIEKMINQYKDKLE